MKILYYYLNFIMIFFKYKIYLSFIYSKILIVKNLIKFNKIQIYKYINSN